MAITIGIIREWLERGKKEGATHVIIACDHFSYEDYPVYVKPHENVKEKVEKYQCAKMQSVTEVYDLNMGIEEQLATKKTLKIVFN